MLFALSLSLFFVWVVEKGDHAQRSVEITYTEFLSLVDKQRVMKVRLRGEHLYAVLTQCIVLGSDRKMTRYIDTSVPKDAQNALFALLRKDSVSIDVLP